MTVAEERDGVVSGRTGARLARFAWADEAAGRFVFEVAAPCRARELAASLGVSKTAAGRLFADGRVARAGGGEGAGDAGAPAMVPVPAALGRPLDAQTRLEAGEFVALADGVRRPAGAGAGRAAGPAGAAAAARPVRVLYEDPFVLAVDKPAGLLVHGDGTGAPTLTDLVRDYLAGRGAGCAPQAVQRLDVETTGVVLFSKTDVFQGAFDQLVAGHDAIEKRYLAVVRGSFPQQRCTLGDAIARDRHDARRMRACSAGERGGQDARTRVERLAVTRDGRHSLLALTLETGRRHQIRVHLSAHGHAVVNDELYGARETADGLMLHAYSERFTHPVTGDDVYACAAWPARFGHWFDEGAIGALGGGGERARCEGVRRGGTA